MWPENWRAVRIFLAMGTQWNLIAGPSALMWVGLRYEVLDAVESRMSSAPGAADPDRETVFAQLRAMERAALEVLRSRS